MNISQFKKIMIKKNTDLHHCLMNETAYILHRLNNNESYVIMYWLMCIKLTYLTTY